MRVFLFIYFLLLLYISRHLYKQKVCLKILLPFSYVYRIIRSKDGCERPTVTTRDDVITVYLESYMDYVSEFYMFYYSEGDFNM